MSEKMRIVGAQNTGNPVLDSVVNLYVGQPMDSGIREQMEDTHALLLKLAAKEPGELKTLAPQKAEKPTQRSV